MIFSFDISVVYVYRKSDTRYKQGVESNQTEDSPTSRETANVPEHDFGV